MADFQLMELTDKLGIGIGKWINPPATPDKILKALGKG
jgi:hypothetical protein